MQDDYQDWDEIPEKSKTQVKKEMHALQSLGEDLCKLNKDQLAKIPLPDTLLRAIQEAPKVKTNSARRRHMQFVGRLMREADYEAIQAAYQALMQVSEQHVQQFHLAETWRDRLLAGGDAEISEFVLDFPDADRQQLRQLVRLAAQEAEKQKPPASARKLFKELRALIARV